MGWLDEDSDEFCIGDEPSILESIKPDGGLDIGCFLHHQEVLSLLELSILKQTGLIDNSGSPTGSLTTYPSLKMVLRQSPCSMLYEVWDGDSRRPAKSIDSHWWKMYVEHPMINVPKFHTCFVTNSGCHIANIQFVSDAKQNNWFPHRCRWNSTTPIELLILGGFRYLGQGLTFYDLEESAIKVLKFIGATSMNLSMLGQIYFTLCMLLHLQQWKNVEVMSASLQKQLQAIIAVNCLTWCTLTK
jgi:hypothetical protein